MSAVLNSDNKSDYVIADLSLANWGRKEISIAETEMPGLMAIRREFSSQQTSCRCPNFRIPTHDYSNCRSYRNINRFRG